MPKIVSGEKGNFKKKKSMEKKKTKKKKWVKIIKLIV